MMASSPFTAAIVAAGVANAAVNNLSGADSLLLLEISVGANPSTPLVFEARPIGGGQWFPVGGVEQSSQGIATGTALAPYTITPAGVTVGIKFDITGCNAFRVWSLTTPAVPIVIQEDSGSFFANPPSGAGLQAPVMLAILWQMQHMCFLIANLDPINLAPLFAQNPILPTYLLPATWDVTG